MFYPDAPSAIHRAAMLLAQCEARLLKLHNAITELDRQITRQITRISENGATIEQQDALATALAIVGIPADRAKQLDDWIFWFLRIEGDVSILEPLKLALHERRKLMRYRSEAEAARRRALHRWLAPKVPKRSQFHL